MLKRGSVIVCPTLPACPFLFPAPKLFPDPALYKIPELVGWRAQGCMTVSPGVGRDLSDSEDPTIFLKGVGIFNVGIS